MKNIFYILFTCFLILSCKYKDYKFYEKTEIEGTAYLLNEQTAEYQILARRVEIRFCSDSEGKNCVLKDTTNEKGEFSFTFTPSSEDEWWIFAEIEISKVKYQGSQKYEKGSPVNLVLKAQYKEGIKVSIGNTVGVEPVKNAEVYLFRSLDFAKTAFKETDKTKIKGADTSIITNKHGVAFFANVPNFGASRTYHLLVIDNTKNRRYLKEGVVVNANAVPPVTLVNIMPGSVTEEIKIYNNLLEEDIKGLAKIELLDASNKVFQTSEVEKNNTFTIDYFYEGADPLNKIVGKSTVDGIDYKGELEKVNMSNANLILNSVDKNSIKVLIKNPTNPLSNINAYLFRNLVQAREALKNHNTTGSLRMATTNSKGIAVFSKIDELGSVTQGNHILIVDEAKKRYFLKEGIIIDNTTFINIPINASTIEKKVVLYNNLKEEIAEGIADIEGADGSGNILGISKSDENSRCQINYFYENNEITSLKGETTINGIDYAGSLTGVNVYNNTVLQLTSNYTNSIRLFLKSDNNDPLHNIKVYLFKNLAFANASKTENKVVGNIGEIAISNVKGIVVFGNLPSGTYHILVKDSINNLEFAKIMENFVVTTSSRNDYTYTIVSQ